MRTMMKTTTYAVMHFCVAVTVAYGVSGDWRVALGVGVLEPVVQTVFYGLHERFWAGVPGSAPLPENHQVAA